ncbi:60S ribosomal protein L6, mitochondrial, partial [Linum grandiflorum]
FRLSLFQFPALSFFFSSSLNTSSRLLHLLFFFTINREGCLCRRRRQGVTSLLLLPILLPAGENDGRRRPNLADPILRRIRVLPVFLSLFVSFLSDSAMEAKFFRFLKIVGVGYKARAESEGRLLFLKLGYSHEVELTVPPAVRVFCFKNNVVCCTGIDKQRVHQFAATVRSCKPPEVYKGKGIMYVDEVIKKKQGKKSK